MRVKLGVEALSGHHTRRHTTWLCAVLMILGPALPVWAEQAKRAELIARMGDSRFLDPNNPIVEAIRALKPAIGVPANWLPGTEMRVGDLVFRPGMLIREPDGTLSLTSTLLAASRDELLEVGFADVAIGRDGVFVTMEFAKDGWTLGLDASIGVANAGVVLLSVNSGDATADYELFDGELIPLADDAALREATMMLEDYAAFDVSGNLASEVADGAFADEAGDPDGPGDPVRNIAPAVAVVAVIVAVVIIVCIAAGLLGWFKCAMGHQAKQERPMLSEGGRPWWRPLLHSAAC